MLLEEILEKAASQSRPAFLVGSGISCDEPSALPTGATFGNQLLQSLAAEDADLERVWNSLLADGGQGGQFRFEQLVELVQQGFDKNLELLNVFFECDTPNWYHHAFVRLMAAGCPILTTNFDCLIEEAAKVEACDYECLIEFDEFLVYGRRLDNLDISSNSPLRQLAFRGDPETDLIDALRRASGEEYKSGFGGSPPPTLVKLHGSPRRPDGRDTFETICATLQSVGLVRNYPHVDEVLRKIISSRPLIVIGYSGWDDFDILHYLREYARNWPIVWTVHSSRASFFHGKHQMSAGSRHYDAKTQKVASFLLSCENEEVYIWSGDSGNFLREIVSLLGVTVPRVNYKETIRVSLTEYFAEWKRIYATERTTRMQFCGALCSLSGRWRESAAILHDVIQQRTREADAGELAGLYSNLGIVYSNAGEYEKALSCHAEAATLDESVSDDAGLGRELGSIGRALLGLGRFQEAIKALLTAIEICKAYDMVYHLGMASFTASEALRELGDSDAAAEHLETALTIARNNGFLELESWALRRTSEAKGDVMPLTEADRMWRALRGLSSSQ